MTLPFSADPFADASAREVHALEEDYAAQG